MTGDATPEALVELATHAAHAAGAVLLDRYRGPLKVSTKSSATDVVSDADRAAERAATRAIAAGRPDDGVLAEESGVREGSSGLRWVIDPLDGTVNYLYGRDEWAVSIAAEESGRPVAGVVYVPARGETYHATKGGGAFRDGDPLRVNDPVPLGQAMLSTGFSYDATRRGEQGALVAKVLPAVRDIRRGGSAAVDLADLAAGRTDAYYEDDLHDWDIAAGVLVATEAGATVAASTDTAAESTKTVLAAGPTLYPHLASALRFNEPII